VARGLMAATLLALAALFVALGVWQVERRAWKLRLIAAVDQRVHAPPRPAPGPDQWQGVSADNTAYAHVRVHGLLLNRQATLVQAVTDYGAGFWVLTPLKTDAGWTVLVNRGFVPPERRTAATVGPAGPVTLIGLLRITEPKGGFLRSNDPAANRWYSRDVAVIARARRLSQVAPYFIDADATPNPGGYPIGGLTVIAFPNSHLSYALTWFTMAILSVVGLVLLLRRERESE
jgi:surfeit locus 1 family protein